MYFSSDYENVDTDNTDENAVPLTITNLTRLECSNVGNVENWLAQLNYSHFEAPEITPFNIDDEQPSFQNGK